jgi:hypothetical protein
MRFKQFPPWWSHLLIPKSSRRSAQAGIALYAACTARAVFVQQVAWRAVQHFGTLALPGRARSWVPPMSAETWLKLTLTLERHFGPFHELAIYQQTQPERAGVALLVLQRGRPLCFVKLRPMNDLRLADEERALRAVWAYRPRSFAVPEPLVSETVDDWDFLAVRALPSELHRVPVNPPLKEICAEISDALASLPRPAAIPAHWAPMHGDFTPWNLRAFRAQGLVLIDWEASAWAPPGADEVFYHAAERALHRASSPFLAGDEAIEFWRSRFADDPTTSRDRRLRTSLLRALQEMTP